MMKQVPEILYKYRCFNPRALEMLVKNQIYFASPLDFNDPFDCLAHENMVEDFRKSAEKYIAADAASRGLSEEQITNHLEKINQNEEMIQARDETDTDSQCGIDFIKNELGVVSLSSCSDSILMWAHYADFHKGFCIGFKNYLGVPASTIKEVTYSATIDKGSFFKFFLGGNDTEDRFNEEYEKASILTKYTDWKYEQEWRIVGVKGIGTYDDTCVGEIIFGLKMPQEHRDRIISILSGKEINYFEAVKSKRDFSIDIVSVVSLGI